MYVNGDISYDILWYNLKKTGLTPDLRTIEEEKAAATADKLSRIPSAPEDFLNEEDSTQDSL